jgi:putative protein-disulfide isomerase
MIDTTERIDIIESNTITGSKSSKINITCYTDPLCCWSWASEPSWLRLRNQFEGQIHWRYVMSGLLPNWKRYNDTVNSVSRPLQMGPVWMHASQLSGVPMKYDLWHKDPPGSSYPACIAVKSAMLQSQKAGELFLNYAREALMNKGLNISKSEVILLLAKAIANDAGEIFDYARFENDWKKGAGCESFVEDLKETRLQGIERFPTLVLSSQGKESVSVIGYRPYSVMLETFEKLTSIIETA